MLHKLVLLKVFFTKFVETHIRFFVTAFLIIFMRQTLTDYFGELHKNNNCTFPLRIY